MWAAPPKALWETQRPPSVPPTHKHKHTQQTHWQPTDPRPAPDWKLVVRSGRFKLRCWSTRKYVWGHLETVCPPESTNKPITHLSCSLHILAWGLLSLSVVQNVRKQQKCSSKFAKSQVSNGCLAQKTPKRSSIYCQTSKYSHLKRHFCFKTRLSSKNPKSK